MPSSKSVHYSTCTTRMQEITSFTSGAARDVVSFHRSTQIELTRCCALHEVALLMLQPLHLQSIVRVKLYKQGAAKDHETIPNKNIVARRISAHSQTFSLKDLLTLPENCCNAQDQIWGPGCNTNVGVRAATTSSAAATEIPSIVSGLFRVLGSLYVSWPGLTVYAYF